MHPNQSLHFLYISQTCALLYICFGVVQQKLDQEIKERDEKYADLDAKFTRLHKRAKQRIQEIQKVNVHLYITLCFLF